MRRAEHEKDRAFSETVIDKCRYMTLCLVDEVGVPYCVPLSPVRRDNDIYFHCATAGRKLDAMRAHPQVSISFVGNTAVPPKEFTLYYEAVYAEGTATEVTDQAERVEALRLLCEKYCPDDMGDFERVLRAWEPRTGIWKVRLDKITSKCNFPD